MSKAATVTMIETQAEGFFLVPFNRLHLSEKNVRKAKPNKVALAELAANIAQKGIRQNLIVESSDQTEGHFAVRSGAMMAGGAFFDIHIEGVGAHGARPESSVDPVPVAAQVLPVLR